VHQSALLGQGLLWRSLGRSLLANFKACAALLRLLAAAAQPKAAASSIKYLKNYGRLLGSPKTR